MTPQTPPRHSRQRTTAPPAKHVSFGIIPPQGHRIGIFGPGGIGKTTLAATAPGPVAFFDLDDSLPVLGPSLDGCDVRRVDGATDWQIFSKIILPLARPVLAVIFVISFVFIYNEYILASFVLRDVNQFTYAVGLALFVESSETLTSEFARLAAAAVMGGLPIVVVYVAASEYIVGGLTQGAVKG